MFTHILKAARLLLLGLLCCVDDGERALMADERLVVHEWGTFTALQDEGGFALGGINVDDEPLPLFVHRLGVEAPLQRAEQMMKGAPQRHPLVRLRLETPVVYFYPPDGATTPIDLSLSVTFQGGWLTEFYPAAEVSASAARISPAPDNTTTEIHPATEVERSNAKNARFYFGSLTAKTIGSLAWKQLKVGTHEAIPQTQDNVWTALREVPSATVTAANGESERYLFYRGVGNIEAPLCVISDADKNILRLRANFSDVLQPGQTSEVGPLWLVHIRRNGTCAYRALGSASVTANSLAEVLNAPLAFAERDFAPHHLHELCHALHGALTKAGLYDTEATAMLQTWRNAYFKTPGLRLFALVPREWTDHYIKLTLSEPADVERVMVARIELVSPEQRAILRDFLETKPADLAWLEEVKKAPGAKQFFADRSQFGDLGVEIPEEYQVYLKLGRFRNALLLAEELRNPHPRISQFIHAYGLGPYRWADPPPRALPKKIPPEPQVDSR